MSLNWYSNHDMHMSVWRWILQRDCWQLSSLLTTGWGKIKYPNTKIAISHKCLNIFAPNFNLFVTILCTDILICAVFTWHYVKLTETQTSGTNFTTEQKVDFIIKVIEQQVPLLLWRHYFYVYVQPERWNSICLRAI